MGGKFWRENIGHHSSGINSKYSFKGKKKLQYNFRTNLSYIPPSTVITKFYRDYLIFSQNENKDKYQPSGTWGTRSPPATPHHLQNSKWPPGGPKMADGVWKGVQP